MRDLRLYGDSVLRKTATDVEVFDDELVELVEDMIETMYERDGCGLAAPQVGVPLRLFVVDASDDEDSVPYVVANPVFEYLSDEKESDEEGCLSLPGIKIPVTRSARVTVRGRDGSGNEVLIENAEGLLARALQHEFDHLNGILLIDHATPVKRSLLRGKLKKISESRAEDD